MGFALMIVSALAGTTFALAISQHIYWLLVVAIPCLLVAPFLAAEIDKRIL
jgi:hypothetical protein